MAHQNMQYIQGPQMDWTEDAGLHQRFKDWREGGGAPHRHGAITHQKCRY